MIIGYLFVPLFQYIPSLHHPQKKKTAPLFNSERFWLALQGVDYKFLLIPVVFIILRMWTCIVAILFIYVGLDLDSRNPLVKILINLAVSL